MIRLTAKGLAKYMTGGPAAQRKILRDYKYPEPEGAVQVKYYAEARLAIEQYHSSGNDATVAVAAVDELHTKAARLSGRKQDRVKNNIRAFESYLRNFEKKKLTILSSPDLKFTHGQVVVSAFPDLYVRDGQRHKIIKMDFSKGEPIPRAIRIVLQVTYVAANDRNLPVTAKDVIYVDVSRGKSYTGAKVRTRLMRDVEAACQTIEDVWLKL
jgi:hypothetical protein